MGIQGLIPFLKKSSRPVILSEFKGKTAAIDVYCWLHKGAFSCADKLVRGEPTDGYVTYVMKQVNLLLSFNIKPILVFDGCRLPAKEVTELKRRENRAKNRRMAKELLREGKHKEARECFQRCVDVTSSMAHDVIKACRARNIDTLVAPYEADAQLAFLSQTGVADIVITEDSDLILFGCDKIVFKLDNNGGGMLVEKEKLHLSMNVPRDKFDFMKFRNMCILSGCDYLPSLHGIGLAKACRFFLVTSNPDVFSALCKIPTNLKMPQLEVTLEYRRGFMKAIDTILHQLVFDPFTLTLRPLTPYPSHATSEDMPYCGTFVGHERAHQIALGNVDVQTGEVVDHYDPLQTKLPEMKSSGWETKGDLVSNHPSIWHSNYKTLKSLAEAALELKMEEKKNMKGKKRVVELTALKRKRMDPTTEDVKIETGVSEDFLQSLYLANKKPKVEETASLILDFNVKNILTPESSVSPKREVELMDTGNSSPNSSNVDEVAYSPNEASGIGNLDAKTEAPRIPKEATAAIGDVKTEDCSKRSPVVEDVEERRPRSSSMSVSRNPFAKKTMNPNLENVSPAVVREFSALKRFSGTPTSPVIVRSRYFKLTPKAKEDSGRIESPSADLQSEIEDIIDVKASTGSCTVKSPLKPLNNGEAFKPTTPVTSQSPKKRGSRSFKWSGGLSRKFSFQKRSGTGEAISPCVSEVPVDGDLEVPVTPLVLDTPPPSQMSTGSSPPLEAALRLKENVGAGVLPPSTRKEVVKCTPVKSSSVCRVSGLKKRKATPITTTSKQTQLSLRDMFSCRRLGGNVVG